MRLVPRRAWGAVPPRATTPLPAAAARGLAVHYSGSAADEQDDHANCGARVRGIQRFHMSPDPMDPTKPWFDIAYNHLFCRHGYAFEGRGFGLRSAAQGTKGGNDHYFAVCFLGNDRERRDDLTGEGRKAFADLVLACRRRYPSATELRPHSDFFATACPGDELRAFIARDGWRDYVEPVPIPKWFWMWMRWRLSGRCGPRPAAIPWRISAWAWRRLTRLGLGDR